jgi:hypothetical protein
MTRSRIFMSTLFSKEGRSSIEKWQLLKIRIPMSRLISLCLKELAQPKLL